MKSKKCIKCGSIKDITEFDSKKFKSGNIGNSGSCKECRRFYFRTNQNVKENRNKNYLKNIEKNRKISIEYYKNNKEKRKEYNRERNKTNPQKYNAKRTSEYQKLKRNTDYLFKLRDNLRRPTNLALINGRYKKNKTTEKYLGIDYLSAKTHFEKQFKNGMSWENYGKNGWHIDHIIPLSSAKTKEDLIILFHYTNLQPLWAKDNLKKYNKIPKVQIKLPI